MLQSPQCIFSWAGLEREGSTGSGALTDRNPDGLSVEKYRLLLLNFDAINVYVWNSWNHLDYLLGTRNNMAEEQATKFLSQRERKKPKPILVNTITPNQNSTVSV